MARNRKAPYHLWALDGRRGQRLVIDLRSSAFDSYVILRDEELPGDLQDGDFIYIRNAGGYTTAYASCFNGFPLPEVRVL